MADSFVVFIFFHVYGYVFYSLCVLDAYIYAPQAMEVVKGIRTPGTGITHYCKSVYRFWKLNLGLLDVEPSLHNLTGCV